MTRSLLIFVGLALLMVSFVGLAQQGSGESDGIEDDFSLNEVFEQFVHTRSLGGLTKLSLKKDYDRLLAKTHDYHEGGKDISLEQLRERYDVMLHRLNILLQDKDEELVNIIHETSDKFWEILSDDGKFANMMGTLP